jgi:hypothetical protein
MKKYADTTEKGDSDNSDNDDDDDDDEKDDESANEDKAAPAKKKLNHLLDILDHRRVFSDCWLRFLRLRFEGDLHKKILVLLHTGMFFVNINLSDFQPDHHLCLAVFSLLRHVPSSASVLLPPTSPFIALSGTSIDFLAFTHT